MPAAAAAECKHNAHTYTGSEGAYIVVCSCTHAYRNMRVIVAAVIVVVFSYTHLDIAMLTGHTLTHSHTYANRNITMILVT